MPIRALILATTMLICSHAAAQESYGAYLARLGDCTSCHTAPGGKPYAGGFKVNSPFGAMYGSNITPDPEYGIGNYTLKDFSRAIRRGITPDGEHLYPAMPYPSFAKMTDADVKALYDYFMHEVPPVHEKAPETHLPFPFNQRWGIRFWNWVFTPRTPYQPHPNRDALWNRGAYLVQSLGHCGACHTPRGLAYQERGNSEASSHFLAGETLDHWHAPRLTADAASGLGRWTEADIAEFLGSGHGAGTAAFGSMGQVIENSGQYITPQDRAAIAHYLKSLPPSGEASSYAPGAPQPSFEHPGAGLYANFCARCHGASGEGRMPRIPELAGSSAVLADDATSLIRIVLEGGSAPVTGQTGKPAHMPAFANRFTDQEIADSVNFIRNSWGNRAAPVTAQQVKNLRNQLKN